MNMNSDSFDCVAERIPMFGKALLRIPPLVKEQAFDIHLKAGGAVAVCGAEGTVFLKESGVTRAVTDDILAVTPQALSEVFLAACGHSVFSHEEELKQGYLIVGGACRAGVCGTAVYENGHLKAVRDITSMVFRIPRTVTGCADRLFLEGIPFEQGILLAGEPSSGKTTVLRDVARSLAMGRFSPLHRVVLLDEKGEFLLDDLGPCADVLRGYPKDLGLQLALKMLSPEFLVCDELSPTDLSAIRGSALSGAALLASVHAQKESFLSRPLCRDLLETGAFGTVVFLSGRSTPGEIDEIRQVKHNAIGSRLFPHDTLGA